jgi:sec-independent protein translocase protein TatA
VIGDILQPTHLLFVLVIALLVLGPKRLPEVGRSLGKGLRDFRNALSTDEPERVESGPVHASAAEPAQPAAAQPVAAQTVPSQPVNEPAEHVS